MIAWLALQVPSLATSDIESAAATFVSSHTDTGVQALQASGQLCANGDPKGRLIYIGVISAPRNFLKRELVRKAWLDSFLLKHGRCARAEFLVGHEEFTSVKSHQQGILASPDQQSVEKYIAREQEQHRDIFRLPIVEHYESLPDKTLLLFSRAAYDGYQFIIKIDDDYLLQEGPFARLINLHRTTTLLYAGADLISYNQFPDIMSAPDGSFLPYFGGRMYLLSHALAHMVAVRDADHSASYFAYGTSSEDLCVGRWVQHAATRMADEITWFNDTTLVEAVPDLPQDHFISDRAHIPLSAYSPLQILAALTLATALIVFFMESPFTVLHFHLYQKGAFCCLERQCHQTMTTRSDYDEEYPKPNDCESKA